jgi:hypothetical protein
MLPKGDECLDYKVFQDANERLYWNPPRKKISLRRQIYPLIATSLYTCILIKYIHNFLKYPVKFTLKTLIPWPIEQRISQLMRPTEKGVQQFLPALYIG